MAARAGVAQQSRLLTCTRSGTPSPALATREGTGLLVTDSPPRPHQRQPWEGPGLKQNLKRKNEGSCSCQLPPQPVGPSSLLATCLA